MKEKYVIKDTRFLESFVVDQNNRCRDKRNAKQFSSYFEAAKYANRYSQIAIAFSIETV